MSADLPPEGPNPPDDLPPEGPNPSDDLPPEGPNPPDDLPAGAADHGEPGAAAENDVGEGPDAQGEPEPAGEHPASGMPSLPPPGPPTHPGEVAARAPSPRPAGAVNPYAVPASPADEGQPPLQWILVVVGIPVGFVAWVFGSLLLLNLWTSSSGFGSTGALVLLVVLLLAAVGLIVWRRTRRLAQGFVLGLAIGLVVAGGLCVPLVTSSGL